MKIAFFWTPAFSAKILEDLLKYDNIDIPLVVSQPDKPVWRKKELLPTPVKNVSNLSNIECRQPEKIKWNDEFKDYLKSLDLDFIVVVAYWKIIPKDILEIPKHWCINIHWSILPKYRWASPIQESILNWDNETWLTIMFMNENMDEWDILSTQKVDIDIRDTQTEIFDKFNEIAPRLLVSTLEGVISWDIKWTRQDDNLSSYCTLIKKWDWEINFNNSAFNIYNKFRAYTPWPWIYTYYKWKKLSIESCFFDRDNLVSEWFDVWDVVELEYEHNEILPWQKKYIWIVCMEGILIILDVKLEWKKKVSIFDFINGQKEFLDYNFITN